MGLISAFCQPCWPPTRFDRILFHPCRATQTHKLREGAVCARSSSRLGLSYGPVVTQMALFSVCHVASSVLVEAFVCKTKNKSLIGIVGPLLPVLARRLTRHIEVYRCAHARHCHPTPARAECISALRIRRRFSLKPMVCRAQPSLLPSLPCRPRHGLSTPAVAGAEARPAGAAGGGVERLPDTAAAGSAARDALARAGCCSLQDVRSVH